MTESVQVALITGAFTFAGIIFSRIWGALENRKTTAKIDDAKEKTAEVQRTVTSVADELRPNGGSSTKDYVKRAMHAAESAKEGYDALDARVTNLKKEFARYVVHEARKDLSVSQLVKDEEEYLKQLDEEERAKREQEERDRDRETTFD